MKELVSVVVSCYNEEEVLPIFYKEINKISKEMDYVNFEFLFVDDGSKDNTLKIVKDWYKLIDKMSDTEMVDGARDFRMMKRKVVDAILSLSEYNRYSKGIFSFVGFKTKWISYENVKRAAGKTKWSFWQLFKYALDGMSSFSTAPLLLASLFGILFCFIALIAIIFVIIRTLIYGDPVGGWPSLVCIILLVGGIQLLCIGTIGRYLSKVYLETKKRPIYIVDETNQD